MNLKIAVLAILALLAAAGIGAGGGEAVCRHATRGGTRRVDLAGVRRAQASIREAFALSAKKAEKVSLDGPYESGLPACRARAIRRAAVATPPDLAGKTLAFAPEGRFPAADLRVATSARRVREVDADALADPALAARLGVRCSPTLVRILSEVELELVEGP